MEDLLTSVRRDFGPESPAFRVVATSLHDIVLGLTRLTGDLTLPQADLKDILSLRGRFEEAHQGLRCTVNEDELTFEETEGDSVERTGDATAETVTDVQASQQPDSYSDPLTASVLVRTDPSGHEDNLRRRWHETSEWAKRQGFANPSAPGDGPAELWRALHLLYLRLPASDAAEQRKAAAHEVGLEVRTHDVVIPAFADCAELDFSSSDSIISDSLLGKQQQLIIESSGQGVWERHQALLGPLANVLTVLEMDAQSLKLPLWQIYPKPDHVGADASNLKEVFLDRVTERLKRLKKNAANTDAPPGVEELDALVAVLETVRAVIYLQMPSPHSWWAKNAKDADNHVDNEFKSVGIVRFEAVTGSYPFGSLATLTENIPVNRPPWATTTKQVLWMLRPYIELPNRKKPGRVIYASN